MGVAPEWSLGLGSPVVCPPPVASGSREELPGHCTALCFDVSAAGLPAAPALQDLLTAKPGVAMAGRFGGIMRFRLMPELGLDWLEKEEKAEAG